ncbi:vWA domain-containing protein [Ruminococcus albus]|uniref:VWA-like domain n=1 Tax=Ruminococcus albus TaxID=1264 RepID=A0A1I1CV13_RUMAL|nr:VWA-like domain-containing protein [Ruminococcus albus]SFB66481.1 VWA-like domain [Ruminococcus albus]
MQSNRISIFVGRIMRSRMRILVEHGFYGMLLMHLRIMLSSEVKNFGTDGVFLYFEPDFLDSISDRELDLVMLHAVTHLALSHPKRISCLSDKKCAELAADIIVNSYIFEEYGNDESMLHLGGKILPHKAPDGSEGNEHSLEELYHLLSPNNSSASSGLASDEKSGRGKSDDGSKSGKQSGNKTPASSGSESDKKVGNEKSNDDSKAGKQSGNKVPASSGSEFDKKCGSEKSNDDSKSGEQSGDRASNLSEFDDHSCWQKISDNTYLDEQWRKNISDAVKAIEIQNSTFNYDGVSMLAARLLKDIREPQIDWRQVLNEFIKQEINDYSFEPPDRRFQDSDFFLPDFNVPDDKINNILFMIDASGSMSDDDITDVFSEVRGAVEQFSGRLQGWLGFFDAEVTEPVRFEDVEKLDIIRPQGGGGTRFDIIFQYVIDNMKDEPPVSITILTDGIAEYPPEDMCNDIPVLWVINNDKVEPPWGKVVRLNG